MYGDTDNNNNINLNTNSNNNILIHSIVQIHPDTVPSVLHFRLKYRCVKERELVPWGRSSVWLQRGKAKMINKTFVLFLPPDCLVPFPLFSLVHCRPCPRPWYRTFSFISHQNTHRHSDNIDNGHLEHRYTHKTEHRQMQKVSVFFIRVLIFIILPKKTNGVK